MAVKKVAKYVILPGVIPRIKLLLGSGFGYMAYLMAHIYNMVRLLPDGHPYLAPQNIGLYGIRHVIAEAANNLVLRRQNIDQLIVFGVLLIAMVIMVLQIAILIYTAIVQPAMAQSVASIFNTPNPENDIAFLLLDNVFGLRDFFCNAAGQCTNINGSLPYPFHTALHDMLEFYSRAMLLIGVFIFMYFVLVVLLETATTGSPFGQRFKNVWVPVRLVVAIGLLLPLANGINAGQYITLYAAKIGSGLATNAWLNYNEVLAGNSEACGEDGPEEATLAGCQRLLAKPQLPELGPVLAFLSLTHACAYADWRANYTVDGSPSSLPPNTSYRVQPYFVRGNSDRMPVNTSSPSDADYDEALEFFEGGDFVIRFGVLKDTDESVAGVEATCGEIRIPINDKRPLQAAEQDGAAAVWVQNFYFYLVTSSWGDTSIGRATQKIARRYMAVALDGKKFNDELVQCAPGFQNFMTDVPSGERCEDAQPNKAQRKIMFDSADFLQRAYTQSVAWDSFYAFGGDEFFRMTEDVKNRGWGGAGIWYNRIAQVNGAFIDSVQNLPTPTLMPLVMQDVAEQNRSDENLSVKELYNPFLGERTPVNLRAEHPLTKAKALNDYLQFISRDNFGDKIDSNTFTNIMNMIFGTEGLISITGDGDNADIHPIAQLSLVGKGLVNSTVRNVASSTVFSFLGGPAGVLDPLLGSTAQGAAGLLSSTAFIGITAGVILFYLVPFLPFMFFFFAVAGWVKSLFEAMVGVPLWALAHLRIDGEGLPGRSAENGYFLIFEIFIRPILILFGLIAAMAVFTAQMKVLHFMWPLVTSNVSGPDNTIDLVGSITISRGVVDEFFFTIIYVIIAYLLANASFKLIDNIPQNILRWIGTGVTSFSDINKQDTAGELTKYAATSGILYGEQFVGGITKASQGLGGAVGNELKNLQNLVNSTSRGTRP